MATMTPNVSLQFQVLGIAVPATSPTLTMNSSYRGESVATASASHFSMKVAFDVTDRMMPMIAAPPIPKNMTPFCTLAKILMPNTTNRKPMMLNSVAMKNVTQAELMIQSAASVQPR